MIGQFATPQAFRTSLETRLNAISRERRVALSRLRKRVAFDRLLARLFAEPGAPWLLKGGYAMELRLHWGARPTKDLDLSVPAGDPDRVLEEVRTAARRDLGDGFVFRIGESMREFDQPPEGGWRLPAEAALGGPLFERFHLDVGVGDAVDFEPEVLETTDLLGFAGIAPVRVQAVPRIVQFAEKIHAYTYPRLNSRDRDLVDLILLIREGLGPHREVRRAMEKTFARRNAHPLPTELPQPPGIWRSPFAEKADELELETDLDAAFKPVAVFYREVMEEGI